MDELPVRRVAGVADQVDLGEAGRRDGPGVGLNGNVVLQERARLGPPIEPLLELARGGRKSAIDLPRTDGQQLLLNPPGQAQAAPRPGRRACRYRG